MSDETTPKPAKINGRPPHPSGINTLKAAIRRHANRGVTPVDGRTRASKALEVWKAELVYDLGGESELTTQKRAVIDLALRTRLILDSVDAWLLQQPTLINKRARALFPVVLQRQQLADALVRYLAQLGLERRAHDVVDIAAALSQMRPSTPEADNVRPQT